MAPQLGMVKVADLQEGDLLNLEGDRYADPHAKCEVICVCPGDEVCAGAEVAFAYEFAEVQSIERETDKCLRVDTQLGSYGFPVDHEVPVIRGR